MARGSIVLSLLLALGCEKLNPEFDAPGADAGTESGGSTLGPDSGDSTTMPSTGTASGTGTSSTSTDAATTMETQTTTSSVTTDSGETTDTTTTTDATGSTGPVVIECGTQEVLADAPVLYWRLGEASGTTAVDSSGNGQDGTYDGVTLGAAGVSWDSDPAVELSGSTNSFVSLFPVGAFPTTEFTIEFWAKKVGTGAEEALISYSPDDGLDAILIDEPVGLHVQLFNIDVVTSVDISDGEWHHLAVTWRSSDGRNRIFLDGTLVGLNLDHATGMTLEGAGALVLGQDQDSVNGGFEGNQAFEGMLDEVMVFDQDLAEDRIAAHRASIECVAG